MNELKKNVRVLSFVLAAMFLLLAGYFCYAVYFYGGRWFSNAYNPRIVSGRQDVVAGDILDREGRTLATTKDGKRVYASDRDMRRATSHIVGDDGSVVAAGTETFMAGYLLGFNENIMERAYNLIFKKTKKGSDVHLTIDAKLTTYAADQLGSKNGAIAVMNYMTGEVLAMTSQPSFDPGKDLDTTGSSLVNRVTQGRYPPGSTFKIITAAALIKQGYTDLHFECTGEVEVGDKVIRCAGDTAHGELDLERAFAKSCNGAFAIWAQQLGENKLRQTAEAMGFDENFLFDDLIVYSSSFPSSIPNANMLGWTAVGQGELLATPLHMMLVAAAIARDGVMPEPKTLLYAETDRGHVYAQTKPSTEGRILDESIAKTLKEYMRTVVTDGTGGRASISGLRVCGKTGSAEIDTDKENPHAWFVGFIDDAEHPLAICVLVENGGHGSSGAAPLAKKILEKAISYGH